MGTSILIVVCFLIGSSICSEEDQKRDSRFSIFQIIKFKNEPCIGSSRNGTCFTTAECENAGGSNSGQCADGFGVCCTVILANGATTSLNQSYIVQDASTTLASGSMNYKVCPCNSEVCRIRFDFTSFNLAGPATNPGTGTTGNTVGGAAIFLGTAIGDCLTDTFSISSTQGGTPIICGDNNGQHMIVDTDGNNCAMLNFGLGGGSASRSWDIMVTQYRCGEEAGGPSGCLQWHMEPMGKIRSFNFPNIANTAAVNDNVVHLSNQMYNICIRRPATSSIICYTPCNQRTDAIAAIANMGGSFGVSIAPIAANNNANGGLGASSCSDDYIEIVGGTSKAIAAIGTTGNVANVNSMFCGRQLVTVDNDVFANMVSICTASAPFRVGVNFDADEITAGTASMTKTVETFKRPGGITGFSLCYTTPGATTG